MTGTDGKTTTSLLIARLLRHSGKKVALLSTAVNDLGNGEQPNDSHRTTLSGAQTVPLLKQIRDNGAEYLVMEVSSHGLDQYRVWGIPFSVAVITNLSHEHLDYHGTMERYAAAKARLFKLASRNKKGLQLGVINADDAYAQTFIDASAKPLTYGIKHGDWRAKNIQSTSLGLSFTATNGPEAIEVKSALVGEFNVYNLLAAIAVARGMGIEPAEIAKALPKIEPPAGRMTKVAIKKPYSVFVDYAVTPNALEKALASVRQIAGKGRVLLVFGATGDRDKAKRPIMGEVAARGADQIFLTDDETYREDPETIRQAVYKGVEAAGASNKCVIIADRQKALSAALEAARAGDVVLVTGLGHQTTRNMGGHDEPWNDAEVIKKLS